MGTSTTNVLLFFLVLIFVPKFEHCCGSSSTFANVSCIPNERVALLKFKGSLIDQSNRLSSWIGEDCCTWKGVICSRTSGHVVKLDLRNQFHLDELDSLYFDEYPGNYSSAFLKGEINPSLLDLKHLEFLDLSMNDFSSSSKFPGFICSLTKLKYLNLSSAGLVGQDPLHLGNLSNLQYLDLGTSSAFYAPSNSFTFANLQWTYTLHSLKYLALSGVNLPKDNSWLHSINMLPSLLEVHLSRCQLPSIPRFLNVNFTSLELFDLSQNGFGSAIPPWLFNFSNIRHLDLSENAFNGSIPSEISSCKFLEVLDLHENNLEGEIQNTLTNLCSPSGCIHSSLKMLNLGSNRFTGYLPVQLGQLKHLEYLNLESNSFQGPIPVSLGRLSSLRQLGLGRNNLNGSIPKSFGQLSNLQVLDVSDNLLGGMVSEIHLANLRCLTTLGLSSNSFVIEFRPKWVPPFQLQGIGMSSCRLGPQFPQWLQTQKNVAFLEMSNASIFDTIPDWFEEISSSILWLDLSYNHIRKCLPKLRKSSIAIATIGRNIYLNGNKFEGPLATFPPDVGELDLSSNSLSGPIPEAIAHMWPKLRQLYLSGNQLNGSIPLSICKMKDLDTLDLSENQLSGRLPRCWGQLTSLEVIDLSNNNLNGRIPTSLGSVEHLRSLHLQRNSFQGNLPASLTKPKNLQTLDLGENAFTGTIPSWIGEQFSLEILSIHSNEFDGEIPLELCHLSRLRVLNLARNRIVGTLPRCFSNFSAMIGEAETFEHWLYAGEYDENALVWWKGRELEYTKTLKFLFSIDISSNNLFGEIPKELMSLAGLQNLNLSGNKLQGVIPSNLGNLKRMESLDLSRNKLSGPIPPSISALNFLSYLNLSFNNLSGHIPLGNQLQTLDDRSIYIGNNGLCGPPLMSCPDDESSSECHKQIKGKINDQPDSNLFYHGLIMGYVVGFLGVCSNLYFMKSWRHGFFQLVDKSYNMLWVTLALKANWLRRTFCGGNFRA